MEALFVILGLVALFWIVIGPILFFAQSSRISSLSDEFRRLKLQLDRKATLDAQHISRLEQQVKELFRQAESREFGEMPLPTTSPAVSPATSLTTQTQLPSTVLEPETPTAATLAPGSESVSQVPGVTEHVSGATKADQEFIDSPWIDESPAPRSVKSESVSDPREGSTAEPTTKAGQHTTSKLLREKQARRPEHHPQSEGQGTVTTGGTHSRAFNEMVASQWMSWVGAVAVMIGVGFGLKYAIEEQYLGPTGRVALGILSGMATFVLAAFAMRKDYRVLAEGLAGAAMGMLYFSLFAAFQWYDLMPQLVAFVGMALVTATGLGFAGKTNSLPTAILAMIGGFLTPFMLSKGDGNISALFTYVLILDLGVLALATFRSWGSLHLLNFFGTLLIWLGWLANQYQPGELWLTVGWITLFAIVFSLMGLWRHVIRKEISNSPDTALMLLTPLAYFAALYGLTKAEYSAYHGMMSLGVAAYYLGLGLFSYLRNPGNNQVVVTLVGIGLSFVTLAVPLQLTGHWIVIAWAIESLLLIEIGLRYEKPGFRLTGFGLLVIVQLHMVLYAGGTLTGPQRFSTDFVRRQWEEPATVTPEHSLLGGVINGRSLSFLVNAIVLAILAWEYRRREKTDRIEISDRMQERLGLSSSSIPDAGQISMILIPLVPIMVLAMALLETYTFGVRARWSLAGHLAVLPIWLSLFSGATILSFKRMNDVSSLGGLAKCLYGLTAGLFLFFLVFRFPDWSPSPDPLWGWTLINPRGLGFLTALGSVLFGAIQFSQSTVEGEENRSIGTSLTLAVPLVLLGMCLTETYAYGARHQWLWATQLSQGVGWLAIFSAGTFLTSSWLGTTPRLEMLARLFYVATSGFSVVLAVSTFFDIATNGQTTKSEAWTQLVLNPRGGSLLLATASMLIGIVHIPRTEDQRRIEFQSGLALSLPITLLALCQVESYAYGRREHWIWATFLSVAGIWLSLFSAGVCLASQRSTRFHHGLTSLSRLLLGISGCVIVLLFFGTLASWGTIDRTKLSDVWAIPFINPRGVCFALTVAAAALLWRVQEPLPSSSTDDRPMIDSARTTLGLLAYIVAFLMFTIEVFAMGKLRGWGTSTSLAITGTWSLIGVATIGAGLMIRSATVRILALAVFALTTAKVFLYDVWYLDKPIRIAAFVGLGVALMLTSFLYQRFRERLKEWIKPMCLLLAAMLFGSLAAPVRADAEPDLSTRFTHRFDIESSRSLLETGGDADEFAGIKLTPEVYAASRRQLSDLRVLSLDMNGVSTQIPYLLVAASDANGQSRISLPITRRFEDTTSTTLVFDARQVTAPVAEIQIQVGPDSRNFARRAKLYGTDELESNDWRLLVNDGYLLDSERDRMRSTETTINCPQTRFRYYQLVIENGNEPPLTISGCQARQILQRVASRESYPLQIDNEIRPDQRITRVEMALTGPVPVEKLELLIAGADDFHRNARLFEIHNTRLIPMKSFALVHRAKFHRDSTISIEFDPRRTNRYRLEIENGDDKPLLVDSGRAFGIPQWLVIPVSALRTAEHPLALYVGGDVDAPNYDLSRMHASPDPDLLPPLGMAAGTENPLFRESRPPVPWAERNKSLVWVIVGLGVVVLSLAAAWLLRAATIDDPDSPQCPPQERSAPTA